MATTFAIVAVFVPIAFMSGIIGRFFFQFGVTVAVAVLVSLFVSLHARPDAVVGLARPAGLALPARAVARPLHGARSSAASSGCTRLRQRARLGARPPQERARDRAGVVPRQLRAGAADRHRVRARRPTRASSRCGSTRRSARASSTPTARCAQVEEALKAFPEIDAGDDHGRHRRGPQLRARQPEARRPRASARARRRSSSARSARRCSRSPASSSRSASTGRSGSTCSAPTRRRCRR